MPSLADMQVLTPEQALVEFNRQNEEWQLARRQEQKIICQSVADDTPIINESKPEKKVSSRPLSPKPSITQSKTIPVTAVTVHQPENQSILDYQ